MTLHAPLTPEQYIEAARSFLNPNQSFFESHPEFWSPEASMLRSLVISDVGERFNRIDLEEYLRCFVPADEPEHIAEHEGISVLDAEEPAGPSDLVLDKFREEYIESLSHLGVGVAPPPIDVSDVLGEGRRPRKRWRKSESIKDCMEAIDAQIKPGHLGGDGTDQTAQRNGLILAYNALAKLYDVALFEEEEEGVTKLHSEKEYVGCSWVPITPETFGMVPDLPGVIARGRQRFPLADGKYKQFTVAAPMPPEDIRYRCREAEAMHDFHTMKEIACGTD